MKNKIIFVVLFSAVAFAACSDGMLPKAPEPSASTSPACLMQAYKIGADPTTAVTGEITIGSGEGVVLTYSASPVSAAAELTSEPASVVGQPIVIQPVEKKKEEKKDDKKGAAKAAAADDKKDKKIENGEVKGSNEFRALTENVSFTLTAKNEEKDKKVSECKGHVNVIVSPEPLALTINKFTASATDINGGDKVTLCWDVSPADASVLIVDDQENQVFPAAEAAPAAPVEESTLQSPKALMATGSAKPVSEEEPAEEDAEEAVPAEAPATCVDVTPSATTTYTLTATTADEQSAVSTVTVNVKELEVKVVSFLANGMEAPVLDKAGEARLTWEVTPENASVVIDPEVGAVKSKGEATVKVEKTTTYTLTANVGDVVTAKQVTITVVQVAGVAAATTLSASATDVFAGEELTLNWSVAAPDGGAVPAEGLRVVIDAPDGRTEVAAGTTSATIAPSASGSYAIEVSGVAGGVVRSNQVNIAVRSWKNSDVGGKWRAVGVSGNFAVVGAASNRGGNIQFARLSGDTSFEKVSYSFSDAINSLYFKDFSTPLAKYGDLPINAISVDSSSGRIYAAATGAVLYSDDSGKSWNAMDVITMRSNIKGVYERQSCKGGVQAGVKDSVLANFVQICDVLVDQGRVIIATDLGVHYTDEAGEFVSGKSCWQGIPKVKCSKENELSWIAVHSLTSFGGRIYAGTATGIWVSDNRGESWSDFSGGDVSSSQAIFALAIDSENKKLYSAGPGGAFVAELGGSADWKKLGDVTDGGTIYSLAVDPAQSGTVYAGAEAGIFVSRDFGDNWKNVSESMGGAPAIYGLAVGKSGSSVGVYAATSGGMFSSVATAVKPLVASQPPEVEPTTEPTTEPVPTPAPASTASETMKALLFK
jgi:hypothetical protein